MTKALEELEDKETVERLLLRRAASPGEIVEPALFLTDEARYVVAARLVADGGWELVGSTDLRGGRS